MEQSPMFGQAPEVIEAKPGEDVDMQSRPI